MLDKTKKIPYYLPHMRWPEVKEKLEKTDLAFIPTGSIEQHGPHLPLGTDYLGAFELALAAAPEVNAVVAPASFVGLSRHHMDFPGTLSLSTNTFVQVLFEVAGCLVEHGFRKILLVNAHGGNEPALQIAADKITKETEGVCMVFGRQQLRKVYLSDNIDKLDIHAGLSETSGMLNSHPELVDMKVAQKPKITLSGEREKCLARAKEDPDWLGYITNNLTSTADISNNGVITFLDPNDADPEIARKNHQAYVEVLKEMVRKWRAVEGEDE